MAATTERHLREYSMEAAGLGLFMVAACCFGTLLSHPASPVAEWLPSVTLRRVLMGCAMGATAAVLVYSPWGQQSGAHLNPAITFTFWRLGKVAPRDACCYAAFQTAGALIGVLATASALGGLLSHPAINYVATVPGPAGIGVAFWTEFAISFLQMSLVLALSNSRWARWTGIVAGAMVALYISLVAPLSGMSMNPARTLASAVPAQAWQGIWIYFLAPPLAMLLAAEVHVRLLGHAHIHCAKLHHQNDRRCIFCEYQAAQR